MFVLMGLTSAPLALAQEFEPVAREFVDGVGFLDPNIRADVSNSGLVAFAADAIFPGVLIESLYMTDGDWIASTPLSTAQFSDVKNLEVDDTGNLIFTATRFDGLDLQLGIYRSSLDLTTENFLPTAVIHEGPQIFLFPNDPPVRPSFGLTSAGNLFFSTIRDGAGGLYSGPATGPYSVLRSGSGIFFNTKEMDVNDLGQHVIQMEYSDPTLGLSRGGLIFDAPNQALDEIETAWEKVGVGAQFVPDINNLGQVAFIVTGNHTMDFYDPPNDATGTVVASVNLSPGIWLSTPTPFGEPPILNKLVGTDSGFSSFSQVLLDDFGRIVFRAVKTAGGSGIYDGPDPVANKIVEPGDEIDGRLFSVLYLGKNNDQGQFAMMTSDFYTTDREVWVVTPAPEPGSALALAVGVLGLAASGAKRRHNQLCIG